MSEQRCEAVAAALPTRPVAASPGTLMVILLTRLALNLPFRFVYPFLPAISRGLGVPLTTASLLLTARALATAASPLLGLLADRYSRRSLMLVGIGLLLAGCLLVAVAPGFAWALVAFAIFGLAKGAYDPAMIAYVSDAVPYARRGRVLSVLELSWSLSWLIGVPAAGFLIASAGWRAPFFAVAALGVVSLAAALRGRWEPETGRGPAPGAGIPAEGAAGITAVPAAGEYQRTARWARAGRGSQDSAGIPGWDLFRRLAPAARRLGAVVWLALLANMLQVWAVENVFIVYGAWLEERFSLSVTTLGVASAVIALAEFAAESGAAGLVDRIGSRRAVIGGIVLSAIAYLLLPHAAGGLAGALAGLCLLFLAFEFAIVAVLPLVSELSPGARATVLALNVSAMSFGRVIASLTGPRLWGAGGLILNTGVSAGLALAAALILIFAVKESSAATRRQ